MSITAAVPWQQVLHIRKQDGGQLRDERASQPKALTYLAVLLGIAALIAMIVAHSATPEGRAAAKRREQAQQIAEAMVMARKRVEEQKLQFAKDEEQRKGFQCLNNIDGSHWGMQNAIKERLRNPSSFDDIETAIMALDSKGQHHIIMKYRAENGFGGLNVKEAVGIIDGKSCGLLHLTM